jgi:DNA-binding CsgD family transcriptional regulator
MNTRPCPLSPRQLECVKWISHGKTDWEAAQIMGISKFTVQRTLQCARQKAEAYNAPSLVATALRNGWIN